MGREATLGNDMIAVLQCDANHVSDESIDKKL
jgi:hypothetical protein